ncbi:Stk1 family PASTA domain-containing Ser/Thr kinase [Oscillibacter sp.]|uniref:Stk1 family PASTA domain-containing Ser/Thr kinase n=1 Tax=Oscillibacter sp. TaxID=1945593 RepID=UPI001B61735D|nr:Stk1 family PASTA domain-containing Ser/Thr kinase [Oscillibacter sp.]MBP3509955.1 Stk1 family PASTA domain-containing Ser/Thr kinase [Oscillibacter sp.]
MDQYIGKMLDNRYEILERIGTGGMAVVYKAKCHRLNRLVAVKILKADLAQDEDFRRRFNAESQAVAQLSHPNIVSVYDVSRGGDTEYIVMELIDGITLKQYMEKRGQLNWRESLHFITQIMRGLSHAHSRGIVHRDIKPQNIMVLRDGSVKVADFGIACLENSAQTLTQEALGSVHYISPEQARGDRTDARSDIYSAGVVLYEMLTGRLPFEGDSAVSVAIQHLSSIPLAPREINPDIPEQMELICMKAMASDIDRRYDSADDMIADLEAFRKNPGVSLDFELEDLHPEEVDEPTRPLRVAPSHGAASAVQQQYKAPPAHERERRRDYEDEEPSHGKKQTTVLLVIVGILAIALAAVLFRSILTSFEPPVPETYVVPSVVGYTVEEANNLGSVKEIFDIVVKEEPFYSDYPVGTIARQDPAEGEHRKGDNCVITVWVSAGEETGEMPYVLNKTVQEAKADMKRLIDKYNLVIDDSEEQFSEDVTDRYIISSDPAFGEPLRKGQTVKLVVSKGPELKDVVVSNFVGMTYGDSKMLELLQKSKLTCTDADVETVYSDRPGGEIVWQSLTPGDTAKEWDTIQFQVSSGLAAVTITEDIPLPQDGREKVLMEVFVGDEEKPQYKETLNCSDGYARVSLSGSGTQKIRVYFDGTLAQDLTHNQTFG